MTWIGFALYSNVRLVAAPKRLRRVAELVLDGRWPWPLVIGERDEDDHVRREYRGARAADRLTENLALLDDLSISADLDGGAPEGSGWIRIDAGIVDRSGRETHPYTTAGYTRVAELPEGRSIGDWLQVVHALATAMDAEHGIVTVCPTLDEVMSDVLLTHIGDGLPPTLIDQIDRAFAMRRVLGSLARHPRWGTYLSPGQVAAIGGLDAVRADVAPSRIVLAGRCTFIQLTDHPAAVDDPSCAAKLAALTHLMAPVMPP